MAAITFAMNNLTVAISGVSGYMDVATYTNLDPVNYIFKRTDLRTGEVSVIICSANTTEPTPLPGFKRGKTDEATFSFLGATFPD